MPPIKKFDSTINLHVPEDIKNGIRDRIGINGSTQSEVIRNLLEAGLKATEKPKARV